MKLKELVNDYVRPEVTIKIYRQVDNKGELLFNRKCKDLDKKIFRLSGYIMGCNNRGWHRACMDK